jgi:hypothetical protein
MTTDKWITTRQAVQMLGGSLAELMDRVNAGELEARKVQSERGPGVRLNRSQVEALAEQANGARPPDPP